MFSTTLGYQFRATDFQSAVTNSAIPPGTAFSICCPKAKNRACALKRAMKFLGRNGKHTRSAVQRLAIAVEIPAVDPLNLGTGLEYQDLFRAYGHSSLRCFRLSICLKGAVAGVSALDRVERI